jgi:hypothetical protein
MLLALRYPELPKYGVQQGVRESSPAIHGEHGKYDPRYARDCTENQAGDCVNENYHISNSFFLARDVHICKFLGFTSSTNVIEYLAKSNRQL